MSASSAVCPLTLIAWRLGTVPGRELWCHYVALGGNRSWAELVDYLAGTTAWTHLEHNVLAQALNEDLWDLGYPSLAPYRELPADRGSAIAEGEKGVHDSR